MPSKSIRDDALNRCQTQASKLALVALVMIFASNAFAEAPPAYLTDRVFSFQEAIDHALVHSGLLAAAKAGTDIFEAKLQAAKAEHVPRLQFTQLIAPMVGQRGNAVEGRTDLHEWGFFSHSEVSGYVPIVTFGKIHYLKKARRLGVEVGKAMEEIAKAEVRFQVSKAYFQLSLARELSSVITEGRKYFDVAKRHVDKMEADDDPSFDPVDKMKIRVYEALIMQYDLAAKRGLTLALGQTRRMIGLDPHDGVDFITAAPVPVVPRSEVTLQVAIDAALESRAELVALRKGILAREAEVSARKFRFFPDLVAVGQAKYSYSNVADNQSSPFAYDPFNTWTVGGGVALRWDINIGQRLAELKEAKAERAKLVAQLDEADRGVRLEVEKLFLEMNDAKSMLSAQADALKAARSWVLAKTDLYQNGLAELRDTLDGLVQFFTSQMAYLQAIYDYNVAVAALERATGMILLPDDPIGEDLE